MSVDNLWCLFFFKILLALVLPVGKYMSTVFTGGNTWLDPIMDLIDKAIYKLDTRRAMPTTPDKMHIDDSHFANILFVNYHDH
jgi:K+-transporting ATPase A subunit